MLQPEEVDIEDTNLAGIGSEEDKACREAAAALEMNWEGAGTEPGIQVWRIENKRNDDGTPNFGINKWPKRKYGKFYRGDSYIVLQTRLQEDKFIYDVFFWIGSESTQDEYGVAAYKATELDDFLGGTPVQHREVEAHESSFFIPGCFPRGITYLNGGIESGFRRISEEEQVEYEPRLFRIRKEGKTTRASQVPTSWKSLYQGDTFVLDAGLKVYTWFGNKCSPFEKNMAATFAKQLECEEERAGKAKIYDDVESDEFWGVLGGGKGEVISDIQESTSDGEEEHTKKEKEPVKAWSIYDGVLFTKIKEIKGEVTPQKLSGNQAYVVDAGSIVYAWIGLDASKSESKKAMWYATNYLKVAKKPMWTGVVRVCQGQEALCGFNRNVFGF